MVNPEYDTDDEVRGHIDSFYQDIFLTINLPNRIFEMCRLPDGTLASLNAWHLVVCQAFFIVDRTVVF